jgi:hypothetical protein
MQNMKSPSYILFYHTLEINLFTYLYNMKDIFKMKIYCSGALYIKVGNCERNFNLGRRVTYFKKKMYQISCYDMIMNSIKIQTTHRHGKLEHFL